MVSLPILLLLHILLTYALKKKKNFGHVARGILVPWPGIEPASPALQGRFLTIGLPGKSSLPMLLWIISNPLINYDTGSNIIII